MRVRKGLSVVGGLLMSATVDVAANTKVHNVSLSPGMEKTRLVFEMSGPVEHSVYILTSPNRLVIDMTGATLSAPLKLVNNPTPISALRAAQRSSTELRVIVDLKQDVTPKSFFLAPDAKSGHRLVLDLAHDDIAPSLRGRNKSAANVGPSPVKVSRAGSDQRKAPTGERDIIVVLDAGHGGKDPGASSAHGQREKDVVLQIAREVQRQINSIRGFRAELTRTGDEYISLRGRTEIARRMGADLFVSIHADAAPSKAAFGASVFALSDHGASSETARWLANRENRSDLMGGASPVNLADKDRMLASVLLDMSMSASLTSSLDVGEKVLTHLGRITPLHKKRVEQAGFMVLKSPDIPSILVETGFISNANEAAKLVQSNHQQALARAISSGVQQYFQRTPPPGTYMAKLKNSQNLHQGIKLSER